MKRALYFAVIYIASMLFGTLCFATIFMLSCNLTMFVTGLPPKFFSLNFFTTGILLAIPLVCVLVHVLLILYLIRHPKNHIVSLVLYVVFGLLSWCVIIPTDLQLINRYESDTVISRVEATSTGVFRKEDTGVFYYSRINEDGTADGLFFDTTGYLGQEGTVLPLYNEKVRTESAFPYSDILIKNSLQPNKFVFYPLSVYNSLLTAGEYSTSLGLWAWLSFASLGLALLSVYGVQFASSWKLSNVVFVIFSVIVISLINYFYYMNFLPEILKEASMKLSRLLDLKDPLIVIINIIISIVLIGFGVLMGIYRLHGTSILESDE